MSKSVALIDTSVFCEILSVPGKSSKQEAELHKAQLAAKVAANESLLLPITTILETGNHIGQCSSDGGRRRYFAGFFVKIVMDAVGGQSPFTETPFIDQQAMLHWLSEFPVWTERTDEKGKGSGLGDLSIKKEWERQCDLNPGRRVYIWSKDKHLLGYDRPPEL